MGRGARIPRRTPGEGSYRRTMASTCRGCGRPIITSVFSDHCAYCGTKKRMFQTTTTKVGKRRARRAAIDEILQEAAEGAAMSWQDAEMVACEWMRKNGYRDAALTPPGADGGVDVVSKKAIGQVKHHLKPVGLMEMQRLYGIAQSTGKKALFFSFMGYTPKAKEWARAHGIEMYQFPPVRRIT